MAENLCNVEGCSLKVHSWGVCEPHFKKGYRIDICSAENCTQPPWAKGICHAHYAKVSRLQKQGASEKEIKAALKEPVRKYTRRGAKGRVTYDNNGREVERHACFGRLDEEVYNVLKSEADERRVGVWAVLEDLAVRHAKRKLEATQRRSA